MDKTVIELFAGVGGFRVGMNKVTFKDGKVHESSRFHFVWSNQWEPGAKIQNAFNCYSQRFGGDGTENVNIDISKVNKADLPDHTILCGGFPCQDYSVARSLSKEKGIEGKKGVLWWQINDILKAKHPSFVFLENVDRLVKSPHTQPGRDFGIMLRCLYEQGYGVEWRIINAADYGFPQRRRRIYIVAFKNDTHFYADEKALSTDGVFFKDGFFSKIFGVRKDSSTVSSIDIKPFKDLVEVSNHFKAHFENSGFMIDGVIRTCKVTPVLIRPVTMRDIIEHNVPGHYFLNETQVQEFKYLRGAKKLNRTSKEGHQYIYSEGSMSPFDSLDLPGRTMLTSEGTINRSSHIILDPDNNRMRILTPVECERLNMFPDNWTNTGMSEKTRYFIMGNALVCGVVRKIGDRLFKIIDEE
jgi:DNA (cytosine-5)-methyltransferase 1